MEASVLDAVHRMRDAAVGSVLVVDADGRMRGILTERDVLHRAIPISMDLSRVLACQVMTADVVTCPPRIDAARAAEVMDSHRIRHLPMVHEQQVVGILSNRDVLALQLNYARSARAVAEQVAGISAGLKSLETYDLMETLTNQVPAIFSAERAAMLVSPHAGRDSDEPLVSRHNCPCQTRDLLQRLGQAQAEPTCSPPDCCRQQGAQGQAVLVPLDLQDGAETRRAGLFCLCGPGCGLEAGDLLQYKRDLVRQTLTSSLSNACRLQEARATLLVDALTGVASRRFFESRLQEEARRAQRYGRPFCVAIIDVDHFKTINDKFGHLAGDQALRQLAQCIHKNKRSCDVLARFGGDEFLLLLPETTLRNAQIVLERVREAVQETLTPDGQPVTVSCGLEEATGIAANEALRRADMALYNAKHAGRNRVRTWQESSQQGQPSQALGHQTRELQDRLRSMSLQCKEIFLQSIGGLVRAIEARDPYTRSHSENVMRYAMGIAEIMGIPTDEAALIRRSAVIHDLGKIGIPDAILRKRGRLTPEERSVMEQHPMVAVRILGEMEFLGAELPIVRHHHERWDGRGYPDALSGQAIPRGSRILAVADAFDAITSDRVYHTARSLPEAMQEILRGSGGQFDPEVVAAIVDWVDQVRIQLGRGVDVRPMDLLEAQKTCSLVA